MLIKKGNINESFKYLNYRTNGYLLTNGLSLDLNHQGLQILKISKIKNFSFFEQGLGDTIQFCRYIKVLLEEGAKVFLFLKKFIFINEKLR